MMAAWLVIYWLCNDNLVGKRWVGDCAWLVRGGMVTVRLVRGGIVTVPGW